MKMKTNLLLTISCLIYEYQAFEIHGIPQVFKKQYLNYKINDEAQLTCQIQLQQNDTSPVELVWKSKRKFIQTSLHSMPAGDGSGHVLSRSLIIAQTNAGDDESEYICEFSSAGYKHEEKGILRVRGDNQLNISVTSSNPLTLERENSAEWHIAIASNHQAHKIIWYKVNNDQLVQLACYDSEDNQDCDDCDYKIDKQGKKITVSILNVDWEDYGRHELRVDTFAGESKHVNITLEPIKFVTPKSWMEWQPLPVERNDKQTRVSRLTVTAIQLNRTCFHINDTVHASCHVMNGFEYTTVNWYFKPCYKLPGCKNATYSPLNGTDISATPSQIGLVFSTQLKVNESGILICKANNNMTTSVNNKHICVTDVHSKIKILGQSQLNESDNLLMTCIAQNCEQAFNATVINWYLKTELLPEIWLAKDETPVTATLTNESVKIIRGVSSEKSILSIKQITVQEGGVYICEQLHNNYAIREYFSVKVIAGSRSGYLTAYILAIVALFSIIGGLMYAMKRELDKKQSQHFMDFFNKFKAYRDNSDAEISQTEQAHLLPVDRKWEFPRNKLHIEKQLGNGFFGVVYLAKADGIKEDNVTTTVAVKMAKSNADETAMKAMVKEFKIMSHIGRNKFVIELLGAVVHQQEFSIIMEYCPFGNLRKYLLDNKDYFLRDDQQQNRHTTTSADYLKPYQASCQEPSLTQQVLIEWSYQISRGMEWLASRKVLHGDLACRNILLAEKNIVKICDFGQASDLYKNDEYQKSTNLELPIKWMAIESIRDRIFSTQSDVWSFGVLLWELFSLGASPYGEFPKISELWKNLQSGFRLGKPELAPEPVYELMNQCWHEEPKQRCSFTKLSVILSGLLEGNKLDEYIKIEEVFKEDASPDYVEMFTNSSFDVVNEYLPIPQ